MCHCEEGSGVQNLETSGSPTLILPHHEGSWPRQPQRLPIDEVTQGRAPFGALSGFFRGRADFNTPCEPQIRLQQHRRIHEIRRDLSPEHLDHVLRRPGT